VPCHFISVSDDSYRFFELYGRIHTSPAQCRTVGVSIRSVTLCIVANDIFPEIHFVHPAVFQYNHYITSVTTQQTIRRLKHLQFFATCFGYRPLSDKTHGGWTNSVQRLQIH
jgi:hypothetical protein